MHIVVLSPVERESRKGNGVTVRRWQGIFRSLGHEVTIETRAPTELTPDLVVALHARRSAGAIRRLARERPGVPLVLALTGTDVYRDIHENDRARESLEHADRLVVLQERALDELTVDQRNKAHVIHQSIRSIPWSRDVPEPLDEDAFHVSVLAHLRPVKDPFRAAKATEFFPDSSPLKVWHLGQELEEGYRDRAESLSEQLPRYEWLGGFPRRQARLFLSHSDLMVISSKLEGGAHVVSEAIACETPVLASDISGNLGLLGDDYDGYFEVENEHELANRMKSAEENTDDYRHLHRQIQNRQHVTDPTREVANWKQLLQGV